MNEKAIKADFFFNQKDYPISSFLYSLALKEEMEEKLRNKIIDNRLRSDSLMSKMNVNHLQPSTWKLSKSSFIKGKQCIKHLFLDKHKRKEATPFSQEQLTRFQGGRNFESEYRKEQFPDGLYIDEICFNNIRYYPSCADYFLNKHDEIALFEAGFVFNETLILIDVLMKNKDGSFDVFEIKWSSELRDNYLQDASIQYFVLKSKFENIQSFNIVLRDNVEGFKTVNVLNELKENYASIENDVNDFLKVLNGKNEPVVSMGSHCDTPYECMFKSYCSNRLL